MATFAVAWDGEACDSLRSTQTNVHSALNILKIIKFVCNGSKKIKYVLYCLEKKTLCLSISLL